MTTRTTTRTVTFARPFVLGKGDESNPPGEYVVQTDEEMIAELSFPAWRRVATMIHVRSHGATQVRLIDPTELETMLSRDAAPIPSD